MKIGLRPALVRVDRKITLKDGDDDDDDDNVYKNTCILYVFNTDAF